MIPGGLRRPPGLWSESGWIIPGGYGVWCHCVPGNPGILCRDDRDLCIGCACECSSFVRVCGIGMGDEWDKPESQSRDAGAQQPYDSTPTQGLVQDFPGRIVSDRSAIIAPECRTGIWSIVIDSGFMFHTFLIQVHGSVTRRILLVYHLTTLSYPHPDKYPKLPGLILGTTGFNITTSRMTKWGGNINRHDLIFKQTEVKILPDPDYGGTLWILTINPLP